MSVACFAAAGSSRRWYNSSGLAAGTCSMRGASKRDRMKSMGAPTAVPPAVETESQTPQRPMQDLIHRLLVELGEDPSREGLVKTPRRVEKALKFLTSGYQTDVDTVLNGALFSVDYSEMVIVRDIDFYSLCEH